MPNIINYGYSNMYSVPEEIYSTIYENQDFFDGAVNETITGALKVVYKIYEKVNSIVNSNKERVSDYLSYSDEPNQKITKTVLNKILWSGATKTRFLANFIVPSVKQSIIEEINNHFENDIVWKSKTDSAYTPLVRFALKPITNLISSENCFGSSVAFKIVPKFEGCKEPGIDNQYNDSTIPTTRYIVYLDFDSLIDYFISYANFADSPEDVETIESFVETNMATFNKLVYDLSRRIIIELLDRINSVNNNFAKFNSKLNIVTEEINKSEMNKSIVNKMRYLLRSTLSQTFVDDGEFNRLFNKIDNINANDYAVNGANSIYYDDELSAVAGSITNIPELVSNLYNYAFSVYFSNEVVVTLDYGPKEDNILDKTYSKYSYSREFDKKYDLIDMYTQTEKISDYNLRDYFQDLIKKFKLNSNFTPFCCKTMSNGEKEAFLNSKATRIVALYSYGMAVYFDKISKYIQEIGANKANINSKYDSKLCSSLRDTIKDKIFILKKFFVSSFDYIDNNSSINYMNQQCAEEGFSKFGFLLSVVGNHKSLANSLPQKDTAEGKLLDIIGKDYESDETIDNSIIYHIIESNANKLVNDLVVYTL